MDKQWLWEHSSWPEFEFNAAELLGPLADTCSAIGRLRGRMDALGEDARARVSRDALVVDVIGSSAIEGEMLNPDAVRSSVSRRLGFDVAGVHRDERKVEGVVEMTLDATCRADAPLTAERLKGWQAALFPTGFSGMHRIVTGDWRSSSGDPMQVVSGPIERPKVEFQAPPAARVPGEMDRFLRWVESDTPEHPILKAGLAHLWFETIHPFEDGNGRTGRAIVDMLLTRMDGAPHRYYSVAAQMHEERKAYYLELKRASGGSTMDVTPWLGWFTGCIERAVQRAERQVDQAVYKALFFTRVASVPLTERQQKALGKVLDEFKQPITNRTWASLTKVSPDTALRDLGALVDRGVLERLPGGGRSVAYWLQGVPLPSSDRAGAGSNQG